MKRDFLFDNVAYLSWRLEMGSGASGWSFLHGLMTGKEKFPPIWPKFILPLGNLHGDSLCLKEGAPVEPLHTNSYQKKVGGPRCHMGLEIKRLVSSIFVFQTGCNRMALVEAYLSHEAWTSIA
jgi:hypothetical protein